MPHYVIHIGPHKTGSTYLQASFTAIRDELAAKLILYPGDRHDTKGGLSHLPLMQWLRDRKEAAIERQFRSWNRWPFRTVLLSSEEFSLLDPNELEVLKGLIGNNPVSIVIYCRRWSERVISIWKERIRHGHTETLPEFAAALLTNPLSEPSLNTGLLIKRYSDVFGRDQLKLISYDHVIADGLNLRDHFLTEVLDFESEEPAPDRRIHESPSIEDIEIARALNVFEASLGHRYLDSQHKFDLSRIYAQMHKSMKMLTIGGSEAIFSNEDLYSEYGDLFISPRLNRLFLESSSARVSYVSESYLLLENAVNELARLRDELRKGNYQDVDPDPTSYLDFEASERSSSEFGSEHGSIEQLLSESAVSNVNETEFRSLMEMVARAEQKAERLAQPLPTLDSWPHA